MLNSNLKAEMNIIQMPIDPTYKIISVHNNPTSKYLFIITGITQREYEKIKRLNEDTSITIIRGNAEFKVGADDILCYGEIDFHEGSEDSKQLDTFNWLEHLVSKGIGIPSKYNYDKHECSSPIKSYLYTETFRNSVLCRYLHGCLGKPEYTLIFREII